jgi:Fur family peroxide stress response transcriptional regulator
MPILIDHIQEELVRKGIRPSYQRIRVLEALTRKETHLTVDEIFNQLSPEIPTLSKTTVYNTLHMLVEAGLAREVTIDETETRYDATLRDHGHFRCESCGTIYNFEIDLEKMPIQGLNSFVISEKNVYFKGLCPNCVSK